jgi:hypothetical protein
MKLTQKGYACITALLSLLSFGCGASTSKEQAISVLQQLPVGEIIGRIAPASDRIGYLSTPVMSTASRDGGRMIRHDEYSIDIGLKTNAVPGFGSRLCGELKMVLESRGKNIGERISEQDGCSFYVVTQGMHAWVTVSPLLERGDRYWASVIVDEW